jgi:hypothetical protein
MRSPAIHLLCEGLTEVLFVQRVLTPRFRSHGTALTAHPVLTRSKVGSPPAFGGLPKLSLFQEQVRRLLALPGQPLVSMMFDFYGWPKNYPGQDTRPSRSDVYTQVTHLEEALAASLEEERFIPFLCLHETEALVFAGPAEANEQHPKRNILDDLEHMLARANGCPERINDSPNTSPSHRLERLWRPSRYAKTADGVAILQRIGIPRMRATCPHFDSWLRKLEAAAGI